MSQNPGTPGSPAQGGLPSYETAPVYNPINGPRQPANQPLDYGSAGYSMGNAAPANVWAVRSVLCALDGAELPLCCVKCGSTEDIRMKRKQFTWCPPWVYLLILVNLLVALIVAMIVQKKAWITFGLCPRCRAKRSIAIWVTLGLVVLCGAFIAVAVSMENAYLLIPVPVLLLGAAIYGVIAIPTLKPKRIEKDGRAEFNGAGPAFLSTLPQEG